MWLRRTDNVFSNLPSFTVIWFHCGFYVICKKLVLKLTISIYYWMMEVCFLSVTV